MTTENYIQALKDYSKILTEYKSQYFIFNPTLKNDAVPKKKIIKSAEVCISESAECISAADFMKKLNAKIAVCDKCKLSLKRNKTVCGRGSMRPLLMFIGKSPKHEEDSAGEAFVGKTKEVMDNIISKVLEIPLESVYFTNTVKCAAEGVNAADLNKCITACSEYLYEEIEILKPKFICALGNEAMHILFKNQIHEKNTITELHGKSLNYKSIITIPTLNPGAFIYHPDPNKEKRRTVFEDMKKLKQIMIDLNFTGGN